MNKLYYNIILFINLLIENSIAVTMVTYIIKYITHFSSRFFLKFCIFSKISLRYYKLFVDFAIIYMN